MEDLDLPEIKRKKVQEKKAEDKKEFKDLFDSDSEDENDVGFKIRGKLTLTYSFHSHTEIGLLWSFTCGTVGYDVLAFSGLCFVAAWSSVVQKQNLRGDDL